MLLCIDNRQGKDESGSMVQLTLGPNRAIVGKHNMFGDGQSESRPTRFAGARFIHAVKTLEQPGNMFRGNPGPEILHVKFDVIACATCPQDDSRSEEHTSELQ